ncbi:MAG: Tetratricopeptide repeat-containing protein [Frankiales bacterium]|nr:Tetratricopeptide repeat-containing protein [Frankiales bacterium]
MRRWTRAALSGAAVLALTGTLLAVGAASGSPDLEPAPSSAPAVEAVDPLTQAITDLQSDLDRVPGNFRAWSELGLAYVQQARLTADPGLYARAEGAFDESLALRPQDNDTALTGKASLAAARHDFAEALALTDRSLTANAYSATTFAVRSDALTELGRYDQARTAVQQLLDLRPGVDGYTRASYAFELRGDVVRARELLEQAAREAAAPADVAFAQFYLGELAWSSGDLEGARTAYEAGLDADDGYLPLVAGRAKVLAATGDPTAAAAEYRRVVEQLPLPEFLLAYGELLEAGGQAEAAEEQYAVLRATQQLYAANGQDVDTELALFEADHGSPAAAVANAEKAYAKRPDAIFTQDAYAWALHAAGRSREALPIAQASTRLGLRSPALYYRLGTVAAAAGDTATAQAALTKALALNPAFSPLHAPKAQALLDSLR